MRAMPAARPAAEDCADPYWITGSWWQRGPELTARHGVKSIPTRKRPGVVTSIIV
jgi:hypothetical protein